MGRDMGVITKRAFIWFLLIVNMLLFVFFLVKVFICSFFTPNKKSSQKEVQSRTWRAASMLITNATNRK